MAPRGAALLPLAVLLFCACRAPRPADPADVMALEGAPDAFGTVTESKRREIQSRVQALIDTFGYQPADDARELQYLADLLSRPALYDRLFGDRVLTFTRGLREFGWRFSPAEAQALLTAARSDTAMIFEQPPVPAFLRELHAAGLLHEKAADDLVGHGRWPADLKRLAPRPDGVERVRAFARGLPYRFRPRDAGAFMTHAPPYVEASDAEFLAEFFDRVGAEPTPRLLPQYRRLATRPDAVWDLLEIAAEADIRMTGPPVPYCLAELVGGHEGFGEAARDRLERLARKLQWPEEDEFVFLVMLAREPLALPFIEELERRFDYRFAADHAADLILLARKGIPVFRMPQWMERDPRPLTRPALLLGDRPALAFADANDLLFMERLARSRPDLEATERHEAEREIRSRLKGIAIRHRTGTPYRESAEDLGGFSLPDLLKVLLVLDSLDGADSLGTLASWLARDLRDETSEMGGYSTLGPGARLAFELYDGEGGVGRNDRLRMPPRPEKCALEFHFHATDQDDAAFAGPSAGGPGTDLFRAKRHRVDGLVLTSLPGGRLDADFYNSAGYVLDLGIR